MKGNEILRHNIENTQSNMLLYKSNSFQVKSTLAIIYFVYIDTIQNSTQYATESLIMVNPVKYQYLYTTYHLIVVSL